MWIRSQDKGKLINSKFIWMSGFNIVISTDGDRSLGIKFGSYKDEKRCKEILNEIESSIKIDDVLYTMPKE